MANRSDDSMLLFSMGSRFKDDLENGIISRYLAQEFRINGIELLSKNITASIRIAENTWNIDKKTSKRDVTYTTWRVIA